MNILFIFIAMFLGVLLALQPAVNTAMAGQLGSPIMAAVCSIAISLVMLVVLWMTAGNFGGIWANIPKLPLWVLLGGAAGAFFVAGGVLVAPKIGVVMFFICVVAGQMLGAAFVDLVGAFGMETRVISTPRIIGLMLVISGVVLAQSSR